MSNIRCWRSIAVPLTVFLLDYCIRYPNITLTDVAANELEVGGHIIVN
jgi:hypothetical protein